MKYFQVFLKKEYQHNGKDKVRYQKVGQIKVTNNGGKFLSLNWLPHDYIILPEKDDEGNKTN